MIVTSFAIVKFVWREGKYMSDDIKMNELKIENHGVIPKEEEHTTPEELYERLVEKIKNIILQQVIWK